jgi:hypothetical protein
MYRCRMSTYCRRACLNGRTLTDARYHNKAHLLVVTALLETKVAGSNEPSLMASGPTTISSAPAGRRPMLARATMSRYRRLRSNSRVSSRISARSGAVRAPWACWRPLTHPVPQRRAMDHQLLGDPSDAAPSGLNIYAAWALNSGVNFRRLLVLTRTPFAPEDAITRCPSNRGNTNPPGVPRLSGQVGSGGGEPCHRSGLGSCGPRRERADHAPPATHGSRSAT